MSDKLQQILDLVDEFVEEKRNKEKWQPGDWVKYSGPHMDAEEYKAAIESLLSEWLIFGEKGREFEMSFPQLMGKNLGVLTNSGSSANLLMVSTLSSKKKSMKKFHLKKGSKIITPVTCFPTTLNPIIQNGFEPVFCDVEIPSLNPDLDDVERLLKEHYDHNRSENHIKAIMFAHVLGNPPDMDRLMALCGKYGVIFLEDACDSLGSTYDGKPLGSFGVMSTCSFFPAHHMTTGEGGFVATSDPRIDRAMRSFRDWGRACFCNEKKPGDVTSGTACGNRFKEWLPGCKDVTYDHRYVFDEIGYNLKPLDLQAAIGLEQMKKLKEMEAARRINFEKIYEIFKPYEEFFHLPVATAKSDPCWFAFLLTVKENDSFEKQDFIDHMESAKVQTRSYFTGNCLYHPAYQEIVPSHWNLKEMFPNADVATRGSFFLGTFIGLTDEKLTYIKEVVDEFFKEV